MQGGNLGSGMPAGGMGSGMQSGGMQGAGQGEREGMQVIHQSLTCCSAQACLLIGSTTRQYILTISITAQESVDSDDPITPR